MRRTSDPVLRSAVRQHLLDEIAGTSSRRPEASVEPTTMRWVRLSAVALVVAAVVVGSVVVIRAGIGAPDRSDPAHRVVPSPTGSASRSEFEGTSVTAVGTLSGAASGSVRITSRAGGDFTVRIDVTRIDGVPGREVELATSLRDVDCSLDNDSDRSRVIDFGVYDLSKPMTLQLPPLDRTYGNFSGDLSYMSVLVLKPNGGDTTADDSCAPSKMGVVQLRWSRPAAYVALRAVDHGAALAAEGTVHEDGGRPVSYEVAPDDQLASVAARFGLTPQEVLYLNPRRREPSSTMLFIGETLNLDTNDR